MLYYCILNHELFATVLTHRSHKPAIAALLLSLLLVAGNVFAAHVHEDGLAHYDDCESCLQIQAQTGALSKPVSQAPLIPSTCWQVHAAQSARQPAIPAFAARAPPASALFC